MKKKKAYLSYFSRLLLFGSNGVIASFIALSSLSLSGLLCAAMSAFSYAVMVLSNKKLPESQALKTRLFRFSLPPLRSFCFL